MRPILHKIPKDPWCLRINATLKKDPREDPDHESRSITSVPPFPPSLSLSLSLSSFSLTFFFHCPPKITRVWLAPIASMTKVDRPRDRAPAARLRRRGSGPRRRRLPRSYLYKWFFIHAAFCPWILSKEERERERGRGYSMIGIAHLCLPSAPKLCRPLSAVSAGPLSHVEVRVREGHLCFSYTPAPSATRVSFWYSFGVSSRRGEIRPRQGRSRLWDACPVQADWSTR